MRILVVEDDPALLQILEEGFGEQRIEVVTARTFYDGREKAALGISLLREETLPQGATALVTVSWNQYERTTFQVQVVNTRTDRGHAVLGLAFVNVDGLQNKDLLKHLYADTAQAERKAA